MPFYMPADPLQQVLSDTEIIVYKLQS